MICSFSRPSILASVSVPRELFDVGGAPMMRRQSAPEFAQTNSLSSVHQTEAVVIAV